MGGKSAARQQALAQQNAAALQSSAALQVAEMQTGAALEAAQINQDTAIQAAHIAAGGAVAAAHASAGASVYAANLIDERAREAVDRSEAAGALAIEDIAGGREAALAVQEEQFNLANQRLQPFSDLATNVIGEIDAAGTAQGFAARLSQIADSDIYNDLLEERQERSDAALSAAGLTRSGAAARAAAELSTGTQLELDSILYGRQINNLNIGQSAINNQNMLGVGYANNVANIEQNAASNTAATRTSAAAVQGATLTNSAIAGGQIVAQSGNTQAQILAQGANQAAGFYMQGGQAAAQGIQQGAYYAGQGIMGAANATAAGQIGAANTMANYYNNRNNMIGQVAGSVLSAGAMFFSDPRLKENMEPVGKVRGLTLYEWDWKPSVEKVVGMEMSLGFDAKEVEMDYPECVHWVGDMRVIDYDRLHKILNSEEARLAA
jgi:hypothetical protein